MKRLMQCIVGTVAAAVIATTASAAGEQIKFIDTNTWGQGGGGGPFAVQPINFDFAPKGMDQHGAGNGNFLTFCVEKNEYIGNGQTYNVEFNTAALNGGKGGGSPDYLSAQTAFLYTAFIKGTLDDKLSVFNGSNFVYEGASSGAAIQQAIWYLENENGSVGGMAADLVDMANAAVGVGGDWDGQGIGSVRVMNLYDSNGGFAQDQLVLIPLPVPALMGLAGLVGIGLVSRRRRSTLR